MRGVCFVPRIQKIGADGIEPFLSYPPDIEQLVHVLDRASLFAVRNNGCGQFFADAGKRLKFYGRSSVHIDTVAVCLPPFLP